MSDGTDIALFPNVPRRVARVDDRRAPRDYLCYQAWLVMDKMCPLVTVHIKHFLTASFTGADEVCLIVSLQRSPGKVQKPQHITIDAPHLEVHRTAASLA